MKFTTSVKISAANISGTLTAPPSKSVMQRAVAAALLADGTSTISNPSLSEDGRAALGIAEALGAKVLRDENSVKITGSRELKGTTIHSGESGLSLRMFAPIAALSSDEMILSASGSLLERPVDLSILAQHGVQVSSAIQPPFHIRGPLRPGDFYVDGSGTSQFLTGLLTALPLCNGASRIFVTALRSAPYVRLTLSILRKFGISIEAAEDLSLFTIQGDQRPVPAELRVEGDWSGAACLLVAAALTGELELSGLMTDSLQADRALLDVLGDCGAKVTVTTSGVKVERGALRPFDFDATDCPDLFPALAALACGCSGTSRISGVHRLLHKETNRAAAIVEEFTKVGARVSIADDSLLVHKSRIQGGEFSARGDHRMAMAGAVLGLLSSGGVTIDNPGCVAKSYPGFFEDLERIV